MSRPDEPDVRLANEYNDADVDALARQFLAEAEALQAEETMKAEEAMKAEAEALRVEEAMKAEALRAEEAVKAEAEALRAEADVKADTLKENMAQRAAAEKTVVEQAVSGKANTEKAYAEKTDAGKAAAEKQAVKKTAAKKEAHVSDDEPAPEEDFLPFTVSVADSDGLAVPVLDKGVKLPAAVKMNFSAPYKTPSAVKLRLYMGEGVFAKDNILIGDFKLSGIREYRGGITRIVLTLRMERNGDIDIDLLDEGSVSGRHEKIELHLAECREALKDKSVSLSEEDAELRDSYLVLQRGRFIAATAERLLKANRKEIEKEKAVQIRGRIKELHSSVRKTDPAAMTQAQKSAMKNLMNEISAML